MLTLCVYLFLRKSNKNGISYTNPNPNLSILIVFYSFISFLLCGLVSFGRPDTITCQHEVDAAREPAFISISESFSGIHGRDRDLNRS